jgi:hypothetical protein
MIEYYMMLMTDMSTSILIRSHFSKEQKEKQKEDTKESKKKKLKKSKKKH